MTTTLATRVHRHAQLTPDGIAMREKRLGIWAQVTWRTYWDTVELVGHGLLALGIAPGERIAIHAEDRCEWLYTDVATVAVRAATVGFYPTNPPDEVGYLLNHSGARVLVVEDQEQADKALSQPCPALEHIVYLEPRGLRRHPDQRLRSWPDFLELGRRHRHAHPDALAERMSRASADDTATIVYTSGTTGRPKGAMLTVRNVEFALDSIVAGNLLGGRTPSPSDQVLSYLPLCHVAERVFTTWFNAAAAVQVNFAESIATVAANLREVQPTVLFGVPRIWEKLLASVTVRADNATLLKRWYARFWLGRADRIGAALMRSGGTHTVGSRIWYAIGWVAFYRALQDRLGMRRVRFAASAAAPIAPDVLRFFMGIGVPMHELYGMTENAGIATANRPGRIVLGSVGEPQPGTEVRLDPETGEIQTRHPAVFAGYFRDEAGTAAAITPDGWLRTGDVGEWVEGPTGDRTHLKLTDRLKDIIITAGGKNIAPSEAENALKASPYIKEAVVIGDRRPYLTALIGIELDTVGDWAQRRGVAFTTFQDLTTKPPVIELVRNLVEETNRRFPPVAQLKDFRVLPRELDHEDGELTATQKVKRGAVTAAYADLVDEMYGAR